MAFDPTQIAALSGGGGPVPVDSSLQGYTGPMPQGGGSAMPTGGGEAGGNKTAGYASAGMGLVQMAVGMSQLRKARRLPFPGYLATKGPYAEMKSLYKTNMEQGIGSEQRGIMRMENARAQAQQENAISQRSAQSSNLFGRTAALNRTSGEARIAQADFGARQQAMSGVERMNQAMSLITQKDITAQRQFKIDAETAAGQAIKAGSENIARNLAGDSADTRYRYSQ